MRHSRLCDALHYVILCLACFLPALDAAATTASPELLEKVRRANADCFACHSESGLRHPPKPGLDLARLRDALRNEAAFDASSHGGMECRQCHGQGYNAHPHDPQAKQAVSPCEECHAAKVMRVERQLEASVHGKLPREGFSCISCHEPHTMAVAKKLVDPRKIVAQDNRTCLDCHDSDLAFAKLAPGKKTRPDIDRIHAWLPNTRVHWEGVRCIECHTPLTKAQSHEVLSKDKAEKNCISCHSAKSSLNTRLYRHLAESEQRQFGFLNSVILGNSYVLGATRHPLLDKAFIALIALTTAGVVIHGLIRIVAAVLRRRKRHE